jgi:hypothetical protein
MDTGHPTRILSPTSPYIGEHCPYAHRRFSANERVVECVAKQTAISLEGWLFVHPDGRGGCPFCGENIAVDATAYPREQPPPPFAVSRPPSYQEPVRRAPTLSIPWPAILIGLGLLFVCSLAIGGMIGNWGNFGAGKQQGGVSGQVAGVPNTDSQSGDGSTEGQTKPTFTPTRAPKSGPPTYTPTRTPTRRPLTRTPTRAPTRRPPTRTPTSRPPKDTSKPVSASSGCSVTIAGDAIFYNLWSRHRSELGCPQQARQLGADSVYFVEQPFDKGHMFFFSSGSINFVIVKYGTANSGDIGKGTWQSFDSEPWSGKDENFCFEGQGLPYPIYDNFDRVWCAEPNVRARLGNPRNVDSRVWAKETGANNAQHVLAQGFDKGFILRDSDGAAHRLAYVFLRNGNYIREQY